MSRLPIQLIDSIKELNGFGEAAFVQLHDAGEQVTSIRINPAKIKSVSDEELLIQQLLSKLDTNEPVEVVPWCSTGRYLPKRPSFTFDPSFHAGAYYVQEASSMFIYHILKQLYPSSKPGTVLDLCAAPGGKSTLLAAELPGSFIVSNEVIKSRVTILGENISKWGSSNVMVTHNDPKDFQRIAGFFDLMVVDAPCSGSGLFRKDPNAVVEWSEANVALCSLRQQRILNDAIIALKQDGYLIYSTCSYSKEEDEDICDWIIENLKLEPVKIDIESSWGIVETFSDKHKVPAYRFYPDKIKGEGFFIACFMQKRSTDHHYADHASIASISKSEQAIVAPFLNDVNELGFSKQKDTIIAYPKKFEDDVVAVQRSLSVRKSGVAVGVIKGKDLIPHHELALSGLLNPQLPFLDVDGEQAIRYLKRQDLSIEASGKGWMLVRYKGFNLGWVKVLQNRINNYYPTDWRILKD